MGPCKYFFEVPVYRLVREKYYEQRERFIEDTIDQFFPGSARKLLESQRDRKINLIDHLETQYGGPWNFNEIIGFIRLHFLGSQIRGEYFAVTAKRITRTRKKIFKWQTHKLAPEISVPFEATNLEIWNLIKEYVRDCGEEVKGRYVDTECLDVLGLYVDWRSFLFEGRD